MTMHKNPANQLVNWPQEPPEAHPFALAYGIDEAARVIGLSRRTLYTLIADGRLSSVKLRGRRLIPRKSLEQLLAELMETEK
jgi:excisionase family DNA binding protein